MQLPVIFLPHLAVGVTKEISNKRSAPHSWHGTILDLLDTYTEFKGLGQYAQNCLLMMMFSALPQIPKTRDSLQKSQETSWTRCWTRCLSSSLKSTVACISLEYLCLYLATQEQRRIALPPVQLDECWIYNVLDLHM